MPGVSIYSFTHCYSTSNTAVMVMLLLLLLLSRFSRV